jgi:hypothetical protein
MRLKDLCACCDWWLLFVGALQGVAGATPPLHHTLAPESVNFHKNSRLDLNFSTYFLACGCVCEYSPRLAECEHYLEWLIRRTLTVYVHTTSIQTKPPGRSISATNKIMPTRTPTPFPPSYYIPSTVNSALHQSPSRYHSLI